jgi:hypothetical protein
LGLGELSGAELDKAVTAVEIPGSQAALVEMSGTDAKSGQPAKLAGVVVTLPGRTWFYKLMGDAKVVESQKEAFTRFVQGVKY